MLSFLTQLTDNDPKGERGGSQVTTTFTDSLNNTKVIQHRIMDEIANNDTYKLYVEIHNQFQKRKKNKNENFLKNPQKQLKKFLRKEKTMRV